MFETLTFLTNKLYKKNKDKILCLLFIIILGLIVYNFCKENKIIREGVENKEESSIELLKTEIKTEKDELITKEELGSDEKIKFSEFLTDERKGAIKQIAKKIKRRTLRELTQSEDKPQGTEDVAEAGEIIKNKILNDEDKISNFGFNRNLLSVLEFYIGFKIQFEHSGLDIDSVLDENIGGVAMGKGKNMLGNIKKKGSNFDKDSIGGFFS